MIYDTILEQATQYAKSLSELTPDSSSRLEDLFDELREWFDKIPKDFFNESIIVRKYACYSHYYRWTERYGEVFRCVIEITRN
jgi:hypothetical protein